MPEMDHNPNITQYHAAAAHLLGIRSRWRLTSNGEQIQREEKTLAEDENWYLDPSGVGSGVERREKHV